MTGKIFLLLIRNRNPAIPTNTPATATEIASTTGLLLPAGGVAAGISGGGVAGISGGGAGDKNVCINGARFPSPCGLVPCETECYKLG